MADTKPKSTVKAPKNRLPEPCTKTVQTRSKSDHADHKWLDAEIYRLHITGKSNNDIAETLGCHRNKVSAVVRSYTPPTTAEVLADFVRLDTKAIKNLDAALDSADPAMKWDATKFYLTRRSILGEPEDKGTTVNVTVIQQERESKLATGLQRYGYNVPAPGEN